MFLFSEACQTHKTSRRKTRQKNNSRTIAERKSRWRRQKNIKVKEETKMSEGKELNEKKEEKPKTAHILILLQ